jgi:hypothetical protein
MIYGALRIAITLPTNNENENLHLTKVKSELYCTPSLDGLTQRKKRDHWCFRFAGACVRNKSNAGRLALLVPVAIESPHCRRVCGQRAKRRSIGGIACVESKRIAAQSLACADKKRAKESSAESNRGGRKAA